jgi:hypothetical protein
MHPKAPRFIESRSRTLLIRTVLFLVLGTFALSSVALGGMARHPRQLPLSGTVRLEQGPVPAPTVSPSSDVTALPPTLDAGAPTYETLDFVEAQGGIFSIPYDRLSALAMNAPRSVIVIEGALYQALVEGSRLEPLYRQIQKHQIKCLEASSFANGETYSLAVVPMTTLMQGRGPLGIPAPPHPMLVPGDNAGEELPVITRIRIVLQEPYHFDGKTGAYTSDEGK